MSATTILQFPVQHSCPTCNHACPPDDLSDCLRCGQQYCSRCPWECQCDRDAAEIISRGRAVRKGFIARLLAMFGRGDA